MLLRAEPEDKITHGQTDAPTIDVCNESTGLERTEDGYRRLVNNNGHVIWETTFLHQ